MRSHLCAYPDRRAGNIVLRSPIERRTCGKAYSDSDLPGAIILCRSSYLAFGDYVRTPANLCRQPPPSSTARSRCRACTCRPQSLCAYACVHVYAYAYVLVRACVHTHAPALQDEHDASLASMTRVSDEEMNDLLEKQREASAARVAAIMAAVPASLARQVVVDAEVE
ncbi:hypothetical protein EON67_02545 [archaeon]|nr:MAG: hypothetical protein EON67_02545 [archaeon]